MDTRPGNILFVVATLTNRLAKTNYDASAKQSISFYGPKGCTYSTSAADITLDDADHAAGLTGILVALVATTNML